MDTRPPSDPASDAPSAAPPRRTGAFFRLALATVIAVYFLILVGGVVRATGSGMGCPDWPQCFGRWIPPTDVSQLPPDYQEVYAEHGYGEAEFNAAKTWTEYVNRLIGVVIGLLILGTAVASRRYLRTDPPVFWWSVAAFLLVGFQGWLGSVVVSTNLATWMVTLHMLVALVIVAILLHVLVRSQRHRLPRIGGLEIPAGWFAAALVLSLVQIGMGTQVRERVDEVVRAGAARAGIIEATGTLTLVHRSFSLLLLVVNLVLLWKLHQLVRGRAGSLRPLQTLLGALIVGVLVAEILAGVLLFYLAVPPFLQPVHLVLAAVLGGAQFTLWRVWSDASD